MLCLGSSLHCLLLLQEEGGEEGGGGRRCVLEGVLEFVLQRHEPVAECHHLLLQVSRLSESVYTTRSAYYHKRSTTKGIPQRD